jgi:CheY-like chemotaxis protein
MKITEKGQPVYSAGLSRYSAAGANEYLSKPVSLQELNRLMIDLLRYHRY